MVKSCAARVSVAKIETPDGIAKVTDINVPSERITITLEDGSNLKIPLEDFEAPEEGRRPHVISAEVYEEYVQKSQFDALGGAGLVDVINFSGDDIPVGARPAARLDGEGSSSSAEAEGKRRKRRRNRGNKEGENRSNSSQKNNQGKKQSGDRGGEGARSGKKESSGRNRRNRGSASNGQNKRSNNAQGNRQNNGNRKNGGAQGVRPGQKSSGLSSLHENPNTKRDSKSSGTSTHRRSRRRSHTTGGENNAGGQS